MFQLKGRIRSKCSRRHDKIIFNRPSQEAKNVILKPIFKMLMILGTDQTIRKALRLQDQHLGCPLHQNIN